jgi:hypothetical protein
VGSLAKGPPRDDSTRAAKPPPLPPPKGGHRARLHGFVSFDVSFCIFMRKHPCFGTLSLVPEVWKGQAGGSGGMEWSGRVKMGVNIMFSMNCKPLGGPGLRSFAHKGIDQIQEGQRTQKAFESRGLPRVPEVWKGQNGSFPSRTKPESPGFPMNFKPSTTPGREDKMIFSLTESEKVNKGQSTPKAFRSHYVWTVQACLDGPDRKVGRTVVLA